MLNLNAEFIFPHDKAGIDAYDKLCAESGIKRDEGMEYIMGVRASDGSLIAAGGVLGPTIRSIVCSPKHRGSGIMAGLMSELIRLQHERGIYHLFIYGKKEYEAVYTGLGFYKIAEVPGVMVFMENLEHAFTEKIQLWREESEQQVQERGMQDRAARAEKRGASALVMNLNPITLGHRALIKTACAQSDLTHVFVLAEDRSFFTTEERMAMFKAACSDFPGLIMHDSGAYMVSASNFPAYFLKNLTEAAEVQAALDVEVFARIAPALNIRRRFIGSEPFSELGRCYNAIMQTALPAKGITVTELPRFEDEDGIAYSATRVRRALAEGCYEKALKLVPESSAPFITSERLAERIKTRLAEKGEL